MTTLRLALTFAALASQYSPGTMEGVVQVRQEQGLLPLNLPPHDGFVAVKDCSLIGSVVSIQYRDRVETFIVADCAREGDGTAEWMVSRRIAVEVDYPTAERWGIVGELVPIVVENLHLGERGSGEDF